MDKQDFLDNFCYASNQGSFKEHWEKTLGLPPVDLTKISISQMLGIGFILDMTLRQFDPISFTVTPNNKYFICVSNYSGDYYMGLTKNLLAFDASASDLEEACPGALSSLSCWRWIFGCEGKGSVNDLDKICETRGEMPLSLYWLDILKFPPIDFDSLNLSQVFSISQYINLSVLDGEHVHQLDNFVQVYQIVKNYGCGLTQGYYFFDCPLKTIHTIKNE